MLSCSACKQKTFSCLCIQKPIDIINAIERVEKSDDASKEDIDQLVYKTDKLCGLILAMDVLSFNGVSFLCKIGK